MITKTHEWHKTQEGKEVVKLLGKGKGKTKPQYLLSFTAFSNRPAPSN